MAEKDKKYYWLKLKKDFFKRHDIQIIESMENGKDYILFYLKLLCESVDHEGNLRFSKEIPYNDKMLATITNTNIDVVRNAVNVFTSLNMMTLLDDETLYMNKIEDMIGSETYWAQKKREKRGKLNNVGNFPTLSNEIPTCPSKSIDKDIELDKEIEKDNNTNNNTNKDIVEILDYLNFKCNSKYKTTTPKTQTLIKARLKEKFTIADFKKVIDTKVQEWGNDEKMKKYLRPETLFGTKFEGYLNQTTSIIAINDNEEEPDPF